MGRDDFTLETKQLLAQRVGMRCSNPGCLKPTSGPRIDPNKAVNIGVAVHITSASSGGTRYDPSLTPEERKAASNGIWLCQNCAKLVDDDEDRYPVEFLLQWKRRAEEQAQRNVETPSTREDYELLMRKLNALLTSIETAEKADQDTPLTYQVLGGLGADHIDPQPDRLYSRHTLTGITINYIVRNKWLMVEVIYPDGKTFIADIGLGTVISHKLPYPLEEMTVEVDPKHVIREQTRILPNGNMLVTKTGKWGMKVQTVLSPSNKLVSYNIEYAQTSILAPFKKIVVRGPLVVK